MSKVIVLFIVVGLISSTEIYPCSWDSGHGNFSLCNARLAPNSQTKYYEVNDNGTNTPGRNYTYIFNLCSDITTLPNNPYCYNNTLRRLDNRPVGYCSNFTDSGCGSDLIEIDVDTAAYQFKTIEEDFCFRLHDGITPPEWKLINEEDSTEGFILKYSNGDYCGINGQNRELNIIFECDKDNDNGYNIPDIEKVSEPSDNLCSYYITIDSFYGCPIECAIVNNKICNGKGICDYDYTLNKAKCFCYSSYEGKYCETKTSTTTPSPTIGTTKNNSYPDYDGCQYSLTDTNGITGFYDLTYFNLKNDVFDVKDKENKDIYSYEFNICGEIPSTISPSIVPSACWTYNGNKHGPCLNVFNNTCTLHHNTSNYATAVQVDSSDVYTRCYWLSTQLPDDIINDNNNNLVDNNYEIELYDKENSGRGVIFTLNNGDYCESNYVNRQLKINLLCPDTQRNTFKPDEELNIEETVLEDPICTYTLTYESPLACPSKCITENITDTEYGVCNNHGICTADPIAKEIHCLCDYGWTGNKCQTIIDGFIEPTQYPTQSTNTPTSMTNTPTETPTETTNDPTNGPTKPPTLKPTYWPSESPTVSTTTLSPSILTTESPTTSHLTTNNPSINRTGNTTTIPSNTPTNKPSNNNDTKNNDNNKNSNTNPWMVVSIILISLWVIACIGLFIVWKKKRNNIPFSNLDEKGIGLTPFGTIDT